MTSQVKVDSIRHTGASADAITLATNGTCTAKVTNNLSNRNLIINGSCVVAQRGNGTSSALNGWGTTGAPDRFNMDSNLASLTGTQSQDTESPDGFTHSFKVNLTGNTGAMGATEYISIRQKIEAQNLQHLKNGTAGALSTTLSFWVRSPVTGAHAVRIRKEDNTAREITKTYTISTANTWEHKSLTFPGDTAGGGIDNNNDEGLMISWCLGAGSNYTSTDSTSWINAVTAGQFYGHTATVTSQTGAFYLTGVQFEVSDYATSFEHRSYGDELQRCLRYCYCACAKPNDPVAIGAASSSDYALFTVRFPVPMRTEPSMEAVSGGSGVEQWELMPPGNSSAYFSALNGSGRASLTAFNVRANISSNFTAKQAYFLNNANAGGTDAVPKGLIFNAEF